MVDGKVTQPPRSTRPTVAVVASKGGVGRTMIATNLAVSIAWTEQTVLIDADSYCGDVELALKLRPVYRMDDLAHHVAMSSDPGLDPMLTGRSTNLSVLCAPKNPFMADQMDSHATLDAIGSIIDLGRTTIFDTGPGVNPLTISALDMATRVILVCGTDTASVNAARTMLTVMDQLSMDRHRVGLVVNRPSPKTGLQLRDVADALGMDPICVIPEDPAIAVSMNRGNPIVETSPQSKAGKALAQLAQDIRERPVIDSPQSQETMA